MTEYTAKRILLKNAGGEYLVPYTDKLERDLSDMSSEGAAALLAKVHTDGAVLQYWSANMTPTAGKTIALYESGGNLGFYMNTTGTNTTTAPDQDMTNWTLLPIGGSGANTDLSNLTNAGNAKFQAPITGAASSVVLNDLYSNRVVTTNASGKISSTAVSVTEIGYVAGVTSAIQTQMDGKQKFPNYADASAVAICTQSNYGANLPYSCPENGFIQIRPASGGTSFFIGAINGGGYTIAALQSNFAVYPVKKGDVLTRTDSSGTWSVYFIHER